MTGIALLIFTGFILYVMVWSIKNDGVRSIKDQTGLIKMRELSEKRDRHRFEANLSTNSSIQLKPTEQDRRRP